MIIAETRELNYEKGNRIFILVEQTGVPIMASDMQFGDYVIRGNEVTVGVERVSSVGLLQDIESGRMVEKLEGCSKIYNAVILLVEGLILPSKDGKCLLPHRADYSYYKQHWGPVVSAGKLVMEFREYNFHYGRMAEFLTSVSMRWIDKIEWTTGFKDTAERLVALHGWMNKPDHYLQTIKPRMFSMLSRNKVVGEYMLSSIPKVGMATARQILNHFGTIEAVCAASPKDLHEVSGVGPIIANRIYEEFRRPYKQVS